MEVTNANFKELLPQIKKSIENATFLSIDCELTGLNVVSEINAYDTPKQYYEKVRKNSKDFLVIQYGISAFRFVPEEDVFKQQSYNFYIFRRPINRNIPDQRFLCQTSSISFLITQGFDFNKLFKSGISYLNLAEEMQCRENLDEKEKASKTPNSSLQAKSDVIPIPKENQQFINEVMGGSSKMLEKSKAHGSVGCCGAFKNGAFNLTPLELLQTLFEQIEEFIKDETSDELELPKCNAFIRRLLYQTVGRNYKDKVVLKTKQLPNNDRILVVTRFKSQEDLEEQAKKLIEDERNALEDFIGFTKILRLIVDSGKLIVGHNMCLDFLHTIDKFLTPLPEDYEEFKQCAHTLFSNVVDTKYMASSDTFKELIPSTILKDVLTSVTQKPFEVPKVEIEENGQGYSVEDVKEHEAGYDAYITGLSFLSMWNHLCRLKSVKHKAKFKTFRLLQPYLNKIFLMVLRDNPCINLDGQDPIPSRDHVFYLTFPKEWKQSNIVELFSPFGSVHVSWINETSAYVALFRRDQAAIVMRTLCQSDTYKIMTYLRRQSQLQQMNSSSMNTKNGESSKGIGKMKMAMKRKLSSPETVGKDGDEDEDGGRKISNNKNDSTESGISDSFEPPPKDSSNSSSPPSKKSKTFAETTAWD